MINIHTRLAQLATNNNNNMQAASESEEAQQPQHQHQLQFRRPRSFPGGGLYKQLDDVRPVLQVQYVLITASVKLYAQRQLPCHLEMPVVDIYLVVVKTRCTTSWCSRCGTGTAESSARV